jgi:hypothetical protein
VAVDQVALAGSALADRTGDGDVGPQVGAAVLLGHEVADRGRGLLLDRHVGRVVGVRGDGAGELGELGPAAQHGDRGVGHAQRARGGAVDLVPQVRQHRSGRVRAGLLGGPGQRVHAGAEPERHQLVVGGVEVDLVDPLADAVEGAQLGGEALGVTCRFEHPRVPHLPAEPLGPLPRPRRVLPHDAARDLVGGEGVDVVEVRDQVVRDRTLLGEVVDESHVRSPRVGVWISCGRPRRPGRTGRSPR